MGDELTAIRSLSPICWLTAALSMQKDGLSDEQVDIQCGTQGFC